MSCLLVSKILVYIHRNWAVTVDRTYLSYRCISHPDCRLPRGMIIIRWRGWGAKKL